MNKIYNGLRFLRSRSALNFCLKLAITAGCAVVVVRTVDFHEAMRTLARLPLWPFAGLIILVVSLGWVQAWRWSLILTRLGISRPFGAIWRVVFISIGIMQAVPGTVGADAVRVWSLYRQGAPLNLAILSCLFDRIPAALVLVVVSACGLPFLSREPGTALLAIIAIAVGGIVVSGFCGILIVAWLPERWQFGPIARVVSLCTAISSLATDKALMLRTTILSLVIHLGLIFSIYIVLYLLAAEVSWGACLTILPLVLLVSVLPISIGGWGIREGAMVTAFSLLHVPSTLTLAASVAFGIVTAVSGLLSLIIGFASHAESPVAYLGPKSVRTKD